MPTTARKIVDSAARKLSVKRANIDLQDYEYENALELLNDLVCELSSVSVKFRYDKVDDGVDIDRDLYIDDYTYSYLKNALAMRLGTEYAVEPSGSLQAQYGEAKKHLYLKLTSVAPVAKSDLQPVGEGNQWQAYKHYNFYFTFDPTRIETESGLYIEDESGDDFNLVSNVDLIQGNS